jgi:hypothetical protein
VINHLVQILLAYNLNDYGFTTCIKPDIRKEAEIFTVTAKFLSAQRRHLGPYPHKAGWGLWG